jgi:DNA-binding NtrC family response regulator
MTPRSAEGLVHGRAPAVGVSLLVYHHEGAHIVALQPGVPVVVGRTAPSDVIVADVGLSRQHARFSLVDGEVMVEDLGSTNGTLMLGEPIEKATLGASEEVTLGSVTVTLHQGSVDRAPASGDLASHERFRSALELEVVRSRFFERRLSVVFLRARPGTRAHVRFWLPLLQARLRPVDRLGLYSADAIQILLPETGSEQAARMARSWLDAAGNDPALVCGIATFPEAATYGEELLGEILAAAQRTSADEPIQVAAEQQRRTTEIRARDIPRATGPISDSPAMKAVMLTATRVAKGAIPVLLLGETGSGKEVLARLVHESSSRQDKPLLCVNCAAIAASLLESTLFGHEKGSFTGATAQQKGVFESADGGTVFLDEIGELPAPAQAALLRVLETKVFTRVGSTKEIAVDVRVIAATHRDLESMVQDGRFRQDLFFRLNTLTLNLPPLRERAEDIPMLAERFLEDANRANGTSVRAIDPFALQLLRAYNWPGNVRELKNAIERAVLIAQGDTVTVDDLPERVRTTSWLPPAMPAPLASSGGSILAQAVGTLDGDFRGRMDRLEAEVLTHALRETNWNQTEAARRLQMPLRTLVYKIKVHEIRKSSDTRRSNPG